MPILDVLEPGVSMFEAFMVALFKEMVVNYELLLLLLLIVVLGERICS